MYYDTVEEKTLELLKSIQAIPELSELRLVGGTALALQIGHRISIDLDFFGKWNINGSLEPVLSSCGDVVVDNIQRKMQFFTISGIKTDFVEFDYPWISPPVVADGITIAGIEDIGAMKINAIINRGTKKDFVDIAFLLKDYNLSTILDWFKTKYKNGNLGTALRSLAYFEDAETMPMPHMLISTSWDNVKATIIEKLRSFSE